MAHSQESQLVVFSYGSPFANAKLLPERRFSFLGRDVVVRQQCREDGRGGTELGFGAAVYDAAFVLADWLSLHDEVLGARVLELGCGVGLVSIACAALAGPLTQCVFVMTDGDATSVQLATENVERNRVSDKVAVQRLMWGPDVGQLGQFDVVLGADIACFPYAHTFPELKQTLLLATKPGGSGLFYSMAELVRSNHLLALAVILAHKHRDPCEQRFFDALCGVSGPFTLLRRVPPQELHPDMVNEGICIMHLRRNGDASQLHTS